MFENIKIFCLEKCVRIILPIISMIVFPYIIILLFVTYMSHNNFFSYDFFTDGIFGMKLYFLTSMLFLLFLAFLVSSSIIGYIGRKKYTENALENKPFLKFIAYDKAFNRLIMIINFILICFFLALIIAKINFIPWVLFILFFSSLICFHIGILLFHEIRKQIGSLALVIFVTFVGCLGLPDQISNFLSVGLRAFGSGGNIDISITIMGKEEPIYGKLLMISPNYVYIIPTGKKGVSMFPMSSIEQLYKGHDIKQ